MTLHQGASFFELGDGSFHGGDGCGHQGAEADKRNVLLDSGFYNRRRDVFPQVENIVPVVFQKGADNVFADVVYIPVYGSEDDFPFFSRCRPFFPKVGIDLFKRGFGRLRAHEELGQKYRAVFKALADDVKGPGPACR